MRKNEGWTEINVNDGADQTHHVKVQTAPYLRSKLVLELTPNNMNLLTLRPEKREPVGPTFVPTIHQPNVRWLRYKKCLRIKYFCAETQKWTTKTAKVFEAPFEEMQDRVNNMASFLQTHYNQHHSNPPKEPQAQNDDDDSE